MTHFNRRAFLLSTFAFSAAQSMAWRGCLAEPMDGAYADITALTAAYNASGYQLFSQFRKRPGNIVFSPYSIGTAMAMALSGARGATEKELTKVLMQTLTRSQIETANEKARTNLQSYDRRSEPGFCPKDMHLAGQQCEAPSNEGHCQNLAVPKDGKCVSAPTKPSARLSIANGLMLPPGSDNAVLPDYISLLQAKYAAEVFHGATLEQVNAWVGQKTEGKIDRIIDSLGPGSAAILLNAIYFQARWETVFSKSATKDDDFYVSQDEKIKTPMMHHKGYFSLVSGPGYQAIRLPFSVPELSMIVVRPETPDGLLEVSDRLDAGAQTRLFKAFATAQRKPYDLALPKFKFSFGSDLVPAFKAAGLRLALSNEADFQGMTGHPHGLEIGQILHRATFEVAEDGVEAAAVTAITMRFASAAKPTEPVYEPFFVDRPFLFFVHDTKTDAILFEGCFVKPTTIASEASPAVQ